MKQIIVLLLAVATPLFAKQKKTVGQVPDAVAFLKVRTFCIDPSNLDPSETRSLNKFVEQEGKPGKLFSKIPWKFAPDCARADTTVSLVFEKVTTSSSATPPTAPSPSFDPSNPNAPTLPRPSTLPVLHSAISVTLKASDRSSGVGLYQVRGDALESGIEKTIFNPFGKLMKDIKVVQESSGK